MDLLDDILASLRLNGGIVFDTRTRGGWCVVSQFEPGDCAPYFPVPESIISYHYVTRGTFYAQIPGEEPVEVPEGSMVLFPRNDVHLLFTQPGLQPINIAKYMGTAKSSNSESNKIRIAQGSGGAINSIDMDFGGAEANCFCGWLGVLSGAHPLIGALPPMMVINRDSLSADWITSSLRVAASEWNSTPIMVAKLSELFFAQAVRRYADGLADDQGGWLAGLRDPAVARAMAMIHSRYAQELDIDMLAREACVSRTVLGERFVQLLGEPPMRYCARWRMRVAANRLLDGRESTATIAYSVGFSSEAAFNRAFKREYGEPPGAWKRRVEAETQIASLAHAAA